MDISNKQIITQEKWMSYTFLSVKSIYISYIFLLQWFGQEKKKKY